MKTKPSWNILFKSPTLSKKNSIEAAEGTKRNQALNKKASIQEDIQCIWKLPVFAFAKDGCTTTCMVITPLGSSPNGTLHWPTVLLFSNIFPALISLTSFAALGAIFLSDTNQNVQSNCQKIITATSNYRDSVVNNIFALASFLAVNIKNHEHCYH